MGAKRQQGNFQAGAGAARPSGMPAMAFLPLASSARAAASPVSRATKIPFNARIWWESPDLLQLEVRSFSFGQGRRFGTADQNDGRFRRHCRAFFKLASYRARCACKPAKGPRHEVPVELAAMNSVQAPGRLRSRSVWPVGAVSNRMWSKPAVALWITEELGELVETPQSQRYKRPTAAPPCWRWLPAGRIPRYAIHDAIAVGASGSHRDRC